MGSFARDAMPESTFPPVDEAGLLVTCLRGVPLSAPPDIDWRTMLRLAETHGVLLVVYSALVAEDARIPALFRDAAEAATDAAERLAGQLEALLAQFEERGIAVLPLKGPAMAQALYGAATTRSCDDLDLLVRRADFDRSGQLLLEVGFEARTDADDYHRKFLRDGLMVELHFELASPRSFPLDMDGVWRRSGRGNFRGRPIHVLSEEDLVLFLCLHGLKHGFGRLIWILDVALAFRAMQRCSPEQLMQSARRQGLEQVLLIGCEMVRQTLEERPRVMELADAESLEKAGRAVEQIFAEPLADRDDPQIWGLYLQTEQSAYMRWRRRFSFIAATAEDFRWAERHGVWRGFAPLLRPFRLLRKYGPDRVRRILFPPPL